ncbi:MAG: rRNA maturation RNase YbeY [Coriobacteriales bacterium]|jgi:probable rRNA maturation factor|nr:rRNA maturation RNase YbeY [Coriobacteriales bacterium]
MLDNRSGEELPLEHIEELAAFVLNREGFLNPLEVSLSFVDRDEIIALNTSYRNKPRPTDVLSFELDDPWELASGPAGEKAFADELEAEVEVEGGRASTTAAAAASASEDDHILIGDVVINPDVAREHALLDEVSFEEELWILTIHGILHLLGYDHEEPEQAAVMEAREDEYFCQWIAQREGL